VFAVFIGEHENKIDSKFRLSIPAEFRRELEQGDPKWESGKNASMYIVYGDHRRNYLEVLTIQNLMENLRTISKKPRSAKREELQTLFASQTTQATLDETGRIVLSAKLREKLGIDGAAAVIGKGETFEIWKPETYAAKRPHPTREEVGYDPSYDPAIYLTDDEG